jgi:predicted Fe-Mo cluster-binding NifX family protein
MKKIALPTDDNISICPHFGRTRGFRIVEIDGTKVINQEYRQNDFTGHAMGHHHEHHHGHDHNHDEHHAHSHQGIFNALGECKTVIANGMGRRLYDDFQQAGVDVFVTRHSNIDQAIQSYIEGVLDNNEYMCCPH